MVSAGHKPDTEPDSFDGVAWAMQESWPGIFVAGAVFSLLLGIVALVSSIGSISLGSFLVTMVLAFVVPAIGLLLTIFWSVFAFVFVLAFNLTLWESLNRRTAVAIFGGATGFSATYWPLFDWTSVAIVRGAFCLAAVCGAVLFCQFGAIRWGDRKNVFFEASKIESAAADDQKVVPYQFGIKQMLAATVLFGLLFAADRLTSQHEVLVMAGVYAVLQLMGLGLDRALMSLRSRKSATT